MYKVASTILDKVKSYIEENPKMMTALLAGGGLGAAGGALTTGKEDGDDENPGRRFRRRLKNALLGGALGAGAGGLLVNGLNDVATALPEDDVDPVTSAWNSPLTRILGVGAAGSGVGLAQHKYKNNMAETILGARKGTTANPQAALQSVIDQVADAREAAKKGLPVPALGDAHNNLAQRLMNTIDSGSDSLLSSKGGELTSAGINTSKLADTGLDVQGKIFGKDLLGDSNKLSRGLKALLRHANRNKFVYPALLAGAALPEIGSTVGNWAVDLAGGDDATH